jgi:hypothetical protein
MQPIIGKNFYPYLSRLKMRFFLLLPYLSAMASAFTAYRPSVESTTELKMASRRNVLGTVSTIFLVQPEMANAFSQQLVCVLFVYL